MLCHMTHDIRRISRARLTTHTERSVRRQLRAALVDTEMVDVAAVRGGAARLVLVGAAIIRGRHALEFRCVATARGRAAEAIATLHAAAAARTVRAARRERSER